MVRNKSPITDVSNFDSTLSGDCTQKLSIIEREGDLGEITTYVSDFIDKGLLHRSMYCISRQINLRVDGVSETEHSLTRYGTPIASGSYIYIPCRRWGLVGKVSVDNSLQRRGIGTQMKKLTNNHMRQDGAEYAFTFVASDGGRKLASKTGFRPENEVFTEKQIWIRSF